MDNEKEKVNEVVYTDALPLVACGWAGEETRVSTLFPLNSYGRSEKPTGERLFHTRPKKSDEPNAYRKFTSKFLVCLLLKDFV